MNRNTVKKGAPALALVDDGFAGTLETNEVEYAADRPLWLTVAMVAKYLSLGKTKVYELIDAEGLPVVRVGRAVRVPTTRFLQWVEEFERRIMSA